MNLSARFSSSPVGVLSRIALCLMALQFGPSAQAIDADPAIPRFDILEYDVEGNTRLSDVDIEQAITPFLGEGKTLQDVEAARGALEAAYHKAGYLTVLVSIPEQKVDDGNVRLRVIEGQIERLRIKNAEFHSSSRIKQQLPELAAGKIPYFPEVQRQLEALNRSADLKATPVLKAGRSPGLVEVQIEVDDDLPVHGSLELNNRQSPNTTPTRLSGSLRYDNLWQLGHSASLNFQSSPEKTDEVRMVAGTYVMPTDDRGNALVMYAVISRSKFASLAGSPGLGMLGNSNIYGTRYAMALPGLENFTHSLSLGLDYKDVKQTVVVAGSSELPTPITYVPLVAAYNSNWLGNASTTSFDATATLGMRGLLGNNEAEFAGKRQGASADFLALRGGLLHTESIGRWSLAGKLDLQFASGPLVSNEQFSAGGAESVRGYQESERVGDRAVRLAFEMRTPKVNLMKAGEPLWLSGLAFYEGAKLWTMQPVYPQPSTQLLRGAGIGLRLAGKHGLSFDLDLARALDNADMTRSGDLRVHSRLLWNF
ncbi:ShlB/FhaC/HecB family hemolysin secretion/activation protein [Dechloromonas sp. HYN0024]|uniref:ShlB/FhaC/HecB family hemolysin secretion/activation protein n=1 Tax=Dechloromonas sp. HYN0024 TaxID=2231055 RepID=UPI0013C33E89|nr:ShlB/FhaC/HecB family hemolysin secretion/activation protein [Dechloromonas sp. HYN0024]